MHCSENAGQHQHGLRSADRRAASSQHEVEDTQSPATVTAGITKAQLDCDLLLSRRDILRLQGEGFSLSAAL